VGAARGAAAFEEMTVFISGGNSGIGLATAELFRAQGAQVIALGLPELDVSSEASIAQSLSEVSELHALINCAGLIRREAEWQMEGFQQVMDVNLAGTMRMCLAARPLLAKSGGSVVNVASLWSFFGSPRAPAYTASKGAVVQLTKSLAVAWAQEGIRVNAVAPGWIATPLTAELQADAKRSEPLLARTPMQRWGGAEEVANAIAFLCSPQASFITGSVLTVDGGYSAV
jgi:NAD(P)-dependent dehydrogenase (short-subunit alcohol dehydrogenase family)